MAIFDYCESKTISKELNNVSKMAFSFVKAQLDKDSEKWEKTLQARKIAGSKGGKQNQAKLSKAKQNQANQAVSVNVNVNDNVNDNVINTNPPYPPNGGESEQVNKASPLEQRFLEFWQVYPRKKNKETARRAWEKLKPNADLTAEIIKAVYAANKSSDWTKENGRFIPYPATWLNAHGWEDEIKPQRTNSQFRENQTPIDFDDIFEN